MKQRYSVFPRPWGVYYYQDNTTGKQGTLKTRDKAEAYRLVAAKNENEKAPAFSLHLARVYWKAGDPAAAGRTWQNVMDEIPKLKQGHTQHRWLTAIKDKALDSIRRMVVLETQAEHFLKVLEQGTVSTNTYLRRIHNFALDMNWLPWPVLPKKRWPEVQFKEKRGITLAEHQTIIAREKNPERKAFYQLAWHLGASQSDLAFLEAENIDWEAKVISYQRQKTGTVAILRFDEEVAQILQDLPSEGPLFPYLRSVRAGDRSTEFHQRCVGLGIKGVSLHSYRYAWAERAKAAGYPERFAMENLGHNSKAIHRAYSRKARVELPSLGEYERQRAAKTAKAEPMAQAVTV
ncbi:MAG TPA: tyrosine-type recombinase/integrase [Verrucomicrobiae bacterium]|nr:tyrosine-type recombinase/integrase [Verrucomicrobiae bacterium]